MTTKVKLADCKKETLVFFHADTKIEDSLWVLGPATHSPHAVVLRDVHGKIQYARNTKEVYVTSSLLL